MWDTAGVETKLGVLGGNHLGGSEGGPEPTWGTIWWDRN